MNYEIGTAREDQHYDGEVYAYINLDDLNSFIQENKNLVSMNNMDEPEYDPDGEECDQQLFRYVTLKLKRLQCNSDKFKVEILNWKPI